MSARTVNGSGAVFRVVDAMDGPHEGRILRLRLLSGEAPKLRKLRGAELRAQSPHGEVARVRVKGFAVFGGKPSNERLARTGRIDVHVEPLDGGPPIGLRWEVTPD